jgi:hypothetical protein
MSNASKFSNFKLRSLITSLPSAVIVSITLSLSPTVPRMPSRSITGYFKRIPTGLPGVQSVQSTRAQTDKRKRVAHSANDSEGDQPPRKKRQTGKENISAPDETSKAHTSHSKFSTHSSNLVTSFPTPPATTSKLRCVIDLTEEETGRSGLPHFIQRIPLRSISPSRASTPLPVSTPLNRRAHAIARTLHTDTPMSNPKPKQRNSGLLFSDYLPLTPQSHRRTKDRSQVQSHHDCTDYSPLPRLCTSFSVSSSPTDGARSHVESSVDVVPSSQSQEIPMDACYNNSRTLAKEIPEVPSSQVHEREEAFFLMSSTLPVAREQDIAVVPTSQAYEETAFPLSGPLSAESDVAVIPTSQAYEETFSQIAASFPQLGQKAFDTSSTVSPASTKGNSKRDEQYCTVVESRSLSTEYGSYLIKENSFSQFLGFSLLPSRLRRMSTVLSSLCLILSLRHNQTLNTIE